MAASVWSGYLTFGLISMPVRLFSGARGSGISFNQLHRTDLHRVKQQLICPLDNQVLDRSEIVKGYEYRKNEYVVIEPEEIKKIEPKTAKTMNREYTVFLRPHEGGMMLHTMYYEEEVRKVEGFGAPDVELKESEVKVAHQLIEALAAEWEPEKYKDDFQENLKNLIQTKLEGGKIAEVEKPKKLAPVVDLMAALKESLAQMEGKKKPAATAPAAAAQARKRK